MSGIYVSLPDEVLQSAQRISEKVDVPVAELFAGAIRERYDPELALPADQASELRSLGGLTDKLLWTLALERVPEETEDEMDDLMYRNETGTLNEQESAKLQDYVAWIDFLTIRKGAAAAILTERGFDVREALREKQL